MECTMSQLVQTLLVIGSILLAVLLLYVTYCICKRYAAAESDEIQDYIQQPSSNIFKEMFLFIQMRCYSKES